jgi:cytochrome c oxidase assembly protein Cox11
MTVVKAVVALVLLIVLAFVVCAAVGAVILYRTFCHHDH